MPGGYGIAPYGSWPYSGWFGPNVTVWEPPVIGGTLTGAQLLDLDGVARRAESIRFDVLDASLQKIGQIQPDSQRAPDVTNNMNRTLKRTCNGMMLLPDDMAAINPLIDRIRPVWVLSTGDEYPVGVFLFADASRLLESSATSGSTDLVDQTLILDQALETSVNYAAGTSVVLALTELAFDAGIPAVSIEASEYVFGTPVTWSAGKTRLEAMVDCCQLAGFYSPYFDNWGTLVCRSATDLATAVPDHTYKYGTRILSDSTVLSDDLLSAPNRYIVTGSGANDAEVSAYFDVPDEAPHSILSRGFVVANVQTPQGIETPEQALAAAKAAYAQDRSTYKWVEFKSTPDPRHDSFGIVEFLGEMYREQEWRLPLQPGGEMSHSLRRAY